MPAKTGTDAQFGFKEESTWGTAVTVDAFLPLVSESLQSVPGMARSRGIVAGGLALRSEQHNGANTEVGGNVTLELYDSTAAMQTLFKHMFGTITGAGPYTATPADLAGLGLTMQVGKPDVGGTVQPFTYEGCKIASWEITGSTGEIVILSLDVIAEQRRTATALATASYGTLPKPIKFVNSAITFNGATYPVRSFKVRGDNKLSRRFRAGSAYTAEPLHDDADVRMYTGEVVIDFSSLTEITASDAGDEDSFSFVLASGSKSVTLAGNCRRTGGIDPSVQGRGILTQTIPFECIATSSTMSTAISAVLDQT